MKQNFNLSELTWSLRGFQPYEWKLYATTGTPAVGNADIPAIAVSVPGSVQGALRDAHIISDWNCGLNSRQCEWVENRHWVYETVLPDEWLQAGSHFRLQCLGLDYCGCILLNEKEVSRFKNTHLPVDIDLTEQLLPAHNILKIVFEHSPRWLGQHGWTSQISEWKPRYNYYWDWTNRLVQIGIWDEVRLVCTEGREISSIDLQVDVTEGAGRIKLAGKTVLDEGEYRVRVRLCDAAKTIKSRDFSPRDFEGGFIWSDLPVELWYPNGAGTQKLYDLSIELIDLADEIHDSIEKQIGFKRLDWRACEDAPAAADPWICVVNDLPIFMQGVNWTPLRPNFADVTDCEYRARLVLYRDLGINIVRVWGGGFLEKDCFYRLCDELGILVWQDFPLSSSGVGDCSPPDDDQSIAELGEIARSFVLRRRHHASLALWCGGNELMQLSESAELTESRPASGEHPLLQAFAAIVNHLDPDRRFLATSPSGPRFCATKEEYGKGVHWDIHGPWDAPLDLEGEWRDY